MHYKFLLNLLFLFYSVSAFCQNQWEWSNPKPSGYAGREIAFINPATGYIINDKEILKTENAGNTWQKHRDLQSSTALNFKENKGFIVGNNGYVLQTIDAGKNWQEVNVGISENLNSIKIISSDTILLASASHLVKTHDGGKNWQILPLDSTNINKVFFVNSKVYHAASHDGKIYKTTDGGQKWYVTSRVNHYPAEYFTISFVNKKVGFASRAHNSILKTTDGGETWAEIENIPDAIYSFFFFNENVGFITGEYGAIHKTTDGGKTWEWASFQNGRYYATTLLSIYFTNENTGYAVGYRGRIIKTIDGGKTWNDYAPSYNDIRQLSFPSKNIGYAFGGTLLKTTDSGNNWTKLELGSYKDYGVNAGQFFSPDTGIVIANNNYNSKVLKTMDGGKSWTLFNIYLYLQKAKALFFHNQKVGYVSCSDGAYSNGLYKTTNSGLNWTHISYFECSQLYFMNASTGYALRYGDLYGTTDGGVTWDIISEIYGDFTKIFFVNAKVGYVAGEYGSILKTIDGGITWTTLQTEYDDLQTITFYNANIGYAAGEYGSFFTTMDGGQTWQKSTSPGLIYALHITEDKKLFAAGANGVILHNALTFEEYVVNVKPARNITTETVDLTGTIASNGAKIDKVVFEYGLNGFFTNQVSDTPITIAANTSDSVKTSLSGLLPNTTYSYRLKITYKGTEYTSQPLTFKTLPEVDLNLSYVYYTTATTAEITGTAQSNSEEITNILIEYGPTESLGQVLAATPNIVNKKSNSKIAGTLQRLSPITQYYVRLKATHKGKEYVTPIQTFTTRPEYFIKVNQPWLRDSSATLSATIQANKEDITSIVFEYGTSLNFGNEIHTLPAQVTLKSFGNVEATLSKLDKNKIYYYRIKAQQGKDLIFSPVYLFRISGELILITSLPDSVRHNKAILKGFVAPQGQFIGNLSFEYGTTTAYGHTVQALPNTVFGSETKTVQALIENLEPQTTIHFRIKGYMGQQEYYSPDRTFTTRNKNRSGNNKNDLISIYPNPTRKYVIISSNETPQFVEVYDYLGKMLFRKDVKSSSVDVSTLQPGVYHLMITTTSQDVFVKKFVKE